ncbi:AAA family ATPase [Ornithinibacillus caprae]|nr:AAA family ATPase [Ornithinibacillus caprae]
MKQIKLLNLVLTNFKGIKQFELNAEGENVKVYGDNATGKTSLFDAFVWILFDKDSQNKKDFQIKTLQNGKVLHKLNHEVEATFLVDSKKLSLKKVFSEKWTKKRGSITQEFSGHTTDYYIDGVPSKKKEYVDKVASLVDEEIFKLLTSPGYFNEQLHWKKRRDLLLEIAGDVTDEDVIQSNEKLSKLITILGDRSIEDHKKVIAAKRKEINQEMDRIPIRIDEIHRGLPDVSGLDELDLQAQIDTLGNQIEEKQQQINDIKSGGEVNKLRTQISDINLQITNVKNEHAQQGQEELYKLRSRHQEEQSNVSILQSKVRNNEQRKSMNESTIRDLEAQMDELRKQWQEQNALEFDHEANCKCPTCEQELPQEQVTEIATKFNRDKSRLLETINNKGTDLKKRQESIKQENVGIEAEIDKLNLQIEEKQQEIKKFESKITEAESNVQPITENPNYNKLMQERQAIEQQIVEIQESVQESVHSVQNEINPLKEQQNNLQIDLSKLEQHERSKKRIAELEEQERTLAAEFDKTEEELYLAEEFIRTKVNLLEEKINSKFKYARFNLFKENINGGLEEICETTYEGVPYSSGLNNAAKINVGLDIINTLSEHYGVQAPIFVDNAEGVSDFPEIGSQLILLVKPPRFKDLDSSAQKALIREYGRYEEAEKAWDDKNKQLRVESKAKVGVA